MLLPGRLELTIGAGRYERSADNPHTGSAERGLTHYVPVEATLGVVDDLALRVGAAWFDSRLTTDGQAKGDPRTGPGDLSVRALVTARPGEGDEGPVRVRLSAGVSLPTGNVRNQVSDNLNFSSGSTDALAGLEVGWSVGGQAQVYAGADLRTVLALPREELRAGSSLLARVGVRGTLAGGSLGLGLGVAHQRRTPDDQPAGADHHDDAGDPGHHGRELVESSGGDWTYLEPALSWRFSDALSGLSVWLSGRIPLTQSPEAGHHEFQLEDDTMGAVGLAWSFEAWEHEHAGP